MNRKEYISALSASTGMSAEEVNKVVDAIPEVISRCCLDGDTVSVPRFGTFFPDFKEETVVTDESSGARSMLPPRISLLFRPSVILRKKLS